MSSVSMVGTCYVDNSTGAIGELRIEHERIDVSTRGPKPDETWTYTDEAGHFHARSLDSERYPTLITRSRFVDCNGSCGGVCDGGYDVVDYFCRICDELIEPGMIPGPHHATMPGRSTWTVVVQADVSRSFSHRCSVRVETDRQAFFGVAEAVDVTPQPNGGLRATLVGVSALGRRQVTT